MKSTACFVFLIISVAVAHPKPKASNFQIPLTKVKREAASDKQDKSEKPSEILNIDPQVGIHNPPPINSLYPHIFHLRGNGLDRTGFLEKRLTTSTTFPSTDTENALLQRRIPSFQDYLKMMGLETTTQSATNKPKSKRSKKRKETSEEDDTPDIDEKDKDKSPKSEEDTEAEESQEEDDSETERSSLNAGRMAPRKSKAKQPEENVQNIEELKKQYKALLDLVAAQNRFVMPQPHVHKHTTICHSLGRMRRCVQADPALQQPPYNHMINKVRYHSQLIKTITSGIFLRPQYF